MPDGHSPECGLGRNVAPRTLETDASYVSHPQD